MTVLKLNSIRAGAASVTTVAVLTATGLASAADLGGGPKLPPPEPNAYVSPLDTARWTGAYLGLSYGYATGDTAVTGAGGNSQIDQTGGIGTLYGGYNWQLGNIVLGLEGDVGTGNYGGSEGNGANEVSADLNTIASARARAGVLLTPAFLVYATGGFAWGDFDIKSNGVTQSDWLSGYQIGAGTELNVSGPWALRLEYIYTDLDSQTLTTGGATNTFDPDFHTVRAGVSFKF
jgi:outer membrane immunogenic protein